VIWTEYRQMAIFMAMSRHSIADAKNNFSRLMVRVEAGEPVEITRRGKVIAQITRIGAAAGKPLDLDWLKANRITPKAGPGNIIETLRTMRDEERH